MFIVNNLGPQTSFFKNTVPTWWYWYRLPRRPLNDNLLKRKWNVYLLIINNNNKTAWLYSTCYLYKDNVFLSSCCSCMFLISSFYILKHVQGSRHKYWIMMREFMPLYDILLINLHSIAVIILHRLNLKIKAVVECFKRIFLTVWSIQS